MRRDDEPGACPHEPAEAMKGEGVAGNLPVVPVLLAAAALALLMGCRPKQQPCTLPSQTNCVPRDTPPRDSTTLTMVANLPSLAPDSVVVPGKMPEAVLTSSRSHEPAGFTPRWPTWDGATRPITPGGCANLNRFGMCGWAAQTRTLTVERDANGPFLRTLFPGRTSPVRDSIWLPPDFGGGAPSRWMWNASLPAGSTRLYVRATFRVSANWSQWGAHPDSGYVRTRRYNSGTKFFFPRAQGITAAGDTIDSNQNDLIGLVTSGDYRGDSIATVWHEPGAPNWEGIDLRYLEQRNPGGSRNLLGVPVTNCNPTPGCQSGWLMRTPSTCTRGQWCTVEVLLSYATPGDTASTFTTWLNGALIRAGTFRTPAHGNRNNLPVPLTKVWFSYVWSDMTFGGGRLIPWEDQSVDVREFYVSVAP